MRCFALDLVTRLRQLTQLRTAQLNQRRLVDEDRVQSTFDDLLALLDLAFRSIKGVADRTVARIIAEMPEIGTLPNKTASKLAGLAPLANDSGAHKGKRYVRGGRSALREILFFVVSVAGRYEPDFIAFRLRLAAQGKPPKVIRIALAHKLLVRINAKAKDVRKLQRA